MDAITYLRKEHSKFRKTLASIDKTTQDTLKLKKFKIFCEDLVKHETMEQKKWYPVLRKKEKLRDVIKHLISEEKSAAQTIKKFNKKEVNLLWKIKFKKFKMDVDHHAKEEEQELFPKVRQLLNKKELNILGIKMKKFKSQLKSQKTK
jgi:hemerythrin superfamily protein